MSQMCPLLPVVQQQITEDKREYIVETRLYVVFSTVNDRFERKSFNNNDRDQGYEPARLSTPPKRLLSLKPLDANLVEVILI